MSKCAIDKTCLEYPRCRCGSSSNAPPSADELLKALKELSRAYVRLLESGRDRIMALGGDCDPVDVMERGDPYLANAKEAIARAENPSAHVAAGVTGHD